MPEVTADVVIIGGGVNGASIAYHLSRMDVGEIILVEKKHLASGATGRSGAMIREHYQHPALVSIAREASQIFHNFSDAIGGNSRFRQTGRLILFGEEDISSAESNVNMNQSLGVNITTVSPDEIKELLPDVNLEGIAIGIWEEGAGYADPVATTYSFVDQATKNNRVKILTNTEVIGLGVSSGKLNKVITNTGVIHTRTAVNVTGAWGNMVGGAIAEVLPIRPTRVQMINLRRPPLYESLNTIVIDHTTNLYFRADHGYCTLIGGEDPSDLMETVNPNNFGLNADHDKIVEFWDRACRRFPGFDSAICRGGYGAIYDMTPDANPILDKSPSVEGLYIALGFSGHGFKLSPVIGRMMSELIVEGSVRDHDINRFRLNRFNEDDLILPQHPYSHRVHQ